VLEIAACQGSPEIRFMGAGARLIIDDAADFGAYTASLYVGPRIADFGQGDLIDLRGVGGAGLACNYSAATGDLQITGSDGNALATLAFQSSTLGSGNFHLKADGAGGVFIFHG
jgi:hypothetical protein